MSLMNESKINTLFKVGIILISLSALVLVFTAGMTQDVSFDAAFNLQVAKSISHDLVYASTYNPSYINDYRITTNGPLQYLCALLLTIFGDRLGLALTLTLVAFFFLYSAKKYSSLAWLLCITIIFTSATFSDQLTSFLGEITALGFLILGLHTISNAPLSRNEAATLAMGSVFFGFAISTKLISGVVIPFLAFGVCALHQPKLTWANFTSTTVRAIAVSLGALGVFIASFYFSSFTSELLVKFLHAGSLDMPPTAPGLGKFIEHHFWQRSTAAGRYMLHLDSFSNPLTLPLIFLASALLLVSSIFWAPLVLLCGYILISGMDERRIMLIYFPLLLAAAWYASKQLRQVSETRNQFITSRIMPAAFVATTLLLIAPQIMQKGTRPGLFLQTDKFEKLLSLKRSDLASFPVNPDIIRMSQIISATPGKVLTSGWWQFPEYQLASGRNFYDRTAPAPAEQLKGRADLLLLFDKSFKWYPETSIALCSDVIAEMGDLVFCRFKPDTRLNLRVGIEES
ncbi:hypothetical protein [Herbaspirillum huttiense]|uniref:hypothetical protein n=1 Tax=Herbaspirillum huttiense TaxID=863372 RepID=UPI000403D9C4|nr:hypothetical protein [Herbaspirillum huttiense]